MEGGGVRLQGHHVGPNNTRPATGSGSVQSLVRMKRCHGGDDDLILLPVSISKDEVCLMCPVCHSATQTRSEGKEECSADLLHPQHSLNCLLLSL